MKITADMWQRSEVHEHLWGCGSKCNHFSFSAKQTTREVGVAWYQPFGSGQEDKWICRRGKLNYEDDC